MKLEKKNSDILRINLIGKINKAQVKNSVNYRDGADVIANEIVSELCPNGPSLIADPEPGTNRDRDLRLLHAMAEHPKQCEVMVSEHSSYLHLQVRVKAPFVDMRKSIEFDADGNFKGVDPAKPTKTPPLPRSAPRMPKGDAPDITLRGTSCIGENCD